MISNIHLQRMSCIFPNLLLEVLDRTQCVRSATLLTVHTLCTKTLLTVHSLINYMFWESCHSCQSCQRSVVFHYLFTLYSLLYCSMLGRRAYVRCWRRCHAHWGGQGWDQHQLPRGQWGAYVPCHAHWGGLWWDQNQLPRGQQHQFPRGLWRAVQGALNWKFYCVCFNICPSGEGEVTQTTNILNVEALLPEYRDYITHAMHVGGSNSYLCNAKMYCPIV